MWLVATISDSVAFIVVSAVAVMCHNTEAQPSRGPGEPLVCLGSWEGFLEEFEEMTDFRGKQWVNISLVGGVCSPSGTHFLNHRAGSRGRGRGYRGRGSRGGSRGRGMGRGSRGRGRGSMGDHPEDEDDFYEDEMDVRFSTARVGEWLVGCMCCWGWLVRLRRNESIRWQVYVF